MLIGPAFLVAATFVWAWEMHRLARANPETRLPYFGWPPSRPSHSKLLTFAALTLTGFGAAQTARDANNDGYVNLWLIVICWLLVGSVGIVLPMTKHNRRQMH